MRRLQPQHIHFFSHNQQLHSFGNLSKRGAGPLDLRRTLLSQNHNVSGKHVSICSPSFPLVIPQPICSIFHTCRSTISKLVWGCRATGIILEENDGQSGRFQDGTLLMFQPVFFQPNPHDIYFLSFSNCTFDFLQLQDLK